MSTRPFGPRIRLETYNVSASAKSADVILITPQPYARPAHPKQQPSRVLHRRIVSKPAIYVPEVPHSGKLQTALANITGLFA